MTKYTVLQCTSKRDRVANYICEKILSSLKQVSRTATCTRVNSCLYFFVTFDQCPALEFSSVIR